MFDDLPGKRDRSDFVLQRPWTAWTVKAVLSAGAVLSVGMLLLGLPGAFLLEIVSSLGLARKLAPDAVWPLAIIVTGAGSFLIVPLSLALRYRWPHITGWGHVWRTALLTIAASLLLIVLLAR